MQVRKTVTGTGPILEKIRGQEITGYEIHMGVTNHAGQTAFEDDEAVAESGLVIGTYLHGIFENENFLEAFLNYLYASKNLTRDDARLARAAASTSWRSSRGQFGHGEDLADA